MVLNRALLLALVPITFILIVLAGVESAAVKDGKDSEDKGSSKRVFVPASDASNFFKRRSRRSLRPYEEYYDTIPNAIRSSRRLPAQHRSS